MHPNITFRRFSEAGVLLAAAATLVIAACGSGTGSIIFGGSVTGLGAGHAAGLQLQHPITLAKTTVSVNGPFTIEQISMSAALPYALTVASQPLGQSCSVAHGTGIASPGANVNNMLVDCSGTTFNVAVTVAGITSNPSSGLVLQDNGGDNLAVFINNAPLNFNTPLAPGAAYAVSVLTQPTGQTCTVTSASGVIASSNVLVSVSCI